MVLNIVIVLGVIYTLILGLQSILYRKTTTMVGLVGTKTVFTSFASIIWGVWLVIMATVILAWLFFPSMFTHPSFSLLNCILSYVVMFLVCGLIELLQQINKVDSEF